MMRWHVPRLAALLVVAMLGLACGEADWRADDAPAQARNAIKAAAGGRQGLAVWESRRPSGTDALKYRIWKRHLDGSGLAMVSGAADQAGYAHLGPRISPDGRFLVFAGKRWNSGKDPAVTTIWDGEYVTPPFDAWIADIDPRTFAVGPPRELTALRGQVGTGGEDRIFVWKDATTLHVNLPEQRAIFEFDVVAGKLGRKVVDRVQGEAQLSPSGNFVFRAAGSGAAWARTEGQPPYSMPVLARLPGCQVTFCALDSFFVWTADATKGPSIFTIAGGKQEQLPMRRLIPGKDLREFYFPTLSHDGTLFMVGASEGDGSHAFGDYELWLFPFDPKGIRLAGAPANISLNPRSRHPGADPTAGHALDRWPDVWVRSADAAPAAVAKGAARPGGPLDGLASTVLPDMVKRLQAANGFQPVMDSLQQVAAGRDAAKAAEAQRILDHLAAWGTRALARARQAEAIDAAEADAVYRELVQRLAHAEPGKAAAARLAELAGDRAYQDELKAAPLLAALQQQAAALPAAADGSRNAADPAFAKANRGALEAIAAAALRLVTAHPGSRAASGARALTAGLGLEVAYPSSADRIIAEVEAVVARTSDAAPLLVNRQYPEGLVATEYRIERVVSGSLAATRLIAYQLARRGPELLPCARYRPGDRVRLVLGDWSAQTAYHQHQIADDLADPETPYWVFLSAALPQPSR